MVYHIKLYTNIPHEFGLRAIEYFVDYYRQSINPKLITQFILEAASFILSNNSMTFDEMFYLQIELYTIIRNKVTLPVSN